MESIERLLINIGYEPYEAEKLYEMYQKQGKLFDLKQYAETKRRLQEKL